jgi:hypothetical protein
MKKRSAIHFRKYALTAVIGSFAECACRVTIAKRVRTVILKTGSVPSASVCVVALAASAKTI